MVNATPRPHFTPEEEPVSTVQEAGWAPGPVWTRGKSRPHRDSIPDRPVRSQSLYRLRYRAHHFRKYHKIIILGDINAKVGGGENIFKPTSGNDSLHQNSNDNGIRIMNFTTSKSLVVKSTMFPHRNTHNTLGTSPDWKTHNQIDHILMDRRWHSSMFVIQSFRVAAVMLITI